MIQKYLKNVVTLRLEVRNCSGCERCVEVCPRGVFAMENHKAKITDRDLCIECGACKNNCAFGAITVETGVGCAAAIVYSWITGKKPKCGCSSSDSDTKGCC